MMLSVPDLQHLSLAIQAEKTSLFNSLCQPREYIDRPCLGNVPIHTPVTVARGLGYNDWPAWIMCSFLVWRGQSIHNGLSYYNLMKIRGGILPIQKKGVGKHIVDKHHCCYDSLYT